MLLVQVDHGEIADHIMSMDELRSLAPYSGLEPDVVEAVAGGLLAVLKKSKNVEKDEFQKLLEKIDGSTDTLKAYEKQAFRKKLPNPATMLLPRPDVAPPGPPPPVIIKSAYTAVKKATRKDKDAGNTKDLVEEMVKCGIEEEKIVAFISVFITFVQEKTDMDISHVLRLPEEEEQKK